MDRSIIPKVVHFTQVWVIWTTFFRKIRTLWVFYIEIRTLWVIRTGPYFKISSGPYSKAVCDRIGNSGRNRNRIAMIWPEPEPDCHPKKVAGFDRIGRILPDFPKSNKQAFVTNMLLLNLKNGIKSAVGS